MKRLTIGGLLFCAACGGGKSSPTSPSSPQPPAPSPQPSTFTITGTLSSTNGGAPLTASMDFGVATTSAQNGAFSVSVPVTAPTLTLTISGAGLVNRRTYVTPGTRTINLDAISQNASSFDFAFYRKMIRNGYEQPNTLQPVRRWTRTPSFYLKTVDEAGEAIHGPTLDLIEANLKFIVPIWTSGALGTPIVERGTGTRLGQSGWITVRFPSNVQTDPFCGQAQVAVDGGWIDLIYHAPLTSTVNCRVPGAVVAPSTVRHEVGHALGFWHTGIDADLMSGLTWSDGNKMPRPLELSSAAIAYHRPPGNTDPDADPVGTLNLAPMVAR